MPKSRSTITAFIRLGEMPLIVMESLIHRVKPCRKVPVPSVTMSEWMRKTVISSPLITPTASPIPSAARMAQPMPTP